MSSRCSRAQNPRAEVRSRSPERPQAPSQFVAGALWSGRHVGTGKEGGGQPEMSAARLLLALGGPIQYIDMPARSFHQSSSKQHQLGSKRERERERGRERECGA